MALKQRIQGTAAARPWFGELPVQSLYTAGIAGETFLRELKDSGRFMATVCETCDEVYLPGKLFCEQCFARLEKWVEVGPKGTLESWTILCIGLDGKRLEEPELVGLVTLDGATTGMVHRIAGVDIDRMYIGMRVEPVLKPKAKREGAITDILHFKPAK